MTIAMFPDSIRRGRTGRAGSGTCLPAICVFPPSRARVRAKPNTQTGIGVRLPPEWMFGLSRNRCWTWPGARICTRSSSEAGARSSTGSPRLALGTSGSGGFTRRDLARRAAVARIDVEHPAEPRATRYALAELHEFRRPRIGQRVRELRRPDDRRHDGRCRKVGDAETVPDEVTAGADRRFEAVEVRAESLPRSPHPRSVDAHVPAEQGSHEREERAPDEKRPGTEPIRRHAGALGGAIEVRRPEETADVGRDFLVEKRLERERARSLRGIGRIERRVGTPALDLGEDAIRADEGGSRNHEDRELVLPGEQADARHMQAGDERPADVRPALVIERPAHLLVVVRDAEVEEAWRRHGGE